MRICTYQNAGSGRTSQTLLFQSRNVLANSQYIVKTTNSQAQIVLLFKGTSVEVGLAFGKVLRRRRVAAGITQEGLAHEAELQRNYVSLMERGVNQPTITTLLKLAKPLGCTAAEIVGEVEQLIAAYP